MINNHTQLLQALIDKYNLKSYLEIGVANLGYLETVPTNPCGNFNKIKCEFKYGVDPAIQGTNIFKGTSDDYFVAHATQERPNYDLIFIDGDHTKEQAKRDFENSLCCLSDNGFIVIHDVLPENEAGTIVPRQTKVWWGDVYKWGMNISNYSKEISYKTFNIDNGCMLVWKDKKDAYDGRKYNPDYSTYLAWGKTSMNVTDEVII